MSTLTGHDKIQVLRQYATDYPREVFIETGIYNGRASGMHLLNKFREVHLIDHDLQNCMKAQGECPDAFVHFGDSAVVLWRVLCKVDRPALLWLDAHDLAEYDGHDSTPLLAELLAVYASGKEHVVLIDDMRLAGRPGWPTVKEIKGVLRKRWAVTIVDDILRAVPK